MGMREVSGIKVWSRVMPVNDLLAQQATAMVEMAAGMDIHLIQPPGTENRVWRNFLECGCQ